MAVIHPGEAWSPRSPKRTHKPKAISVKRIREEVLKKATPMLLTLIGVTRVKEKQPTL